MKSESCWHYKSKSKLLELLDPRVCISSSEMSKGLKLHLPNSLIDFDFCADNQSTELLVSPVFIIPALCPHGPSTDLHLDQLLCAGTLLSTWTTPCVSICQAGVLHWLPLPTVTWALFPCFPEYSISYGRQQRWYQWRMEVLGSWQQCPEKKEVYRAKEWQWQADRTQRVHKVDRSEDERLEHDRRKGQVISKGGRRLNREQRHEGVNGPDGSPCSIRLCRDRPAGAKAAWLCIWRAVQCR